MFSQKMYRYLGRNGIITTPIKLEEIAPISMVQLKAENGKILTMDLKLHTQLLFLKMNKMIGMKLKITAKNNYKIIIKN